MENVLTSNKVHDSLLAAADVICNREQTALLQDHTRVGVTQVPSGFRQIYSPEI